MMSTIRILALGIVTISLLLPWAAAAQTPVLPDGPTTEHRPQVFDVAEDLSPSASPLLIKPGQGLLVTPDLELRERSDAPVLFQQERDRTNLSLIAAGATLLVAGAFIDGSAGDVVMVTGALFSAVGVYRWVR